uniref:C2 domain-containing protein n=1 Tax=Meloidogyne incognita TaxID=6306 RepID=A0A914NN03_MELIC
MFWLSVEINSVEFRKGCLSTALCHRPTFKLSNNDLKWPNCYDELANGGRC